MLPSYSNEWKIDKTSTFGSHKYIKKLYLGEGKATKDKVEVDLKLKGWC